MKKKLTSLFLLLLVLCMMTSCSLLFKDKDKDKVDDPPVVETKKYYEINYSDLENNFVFSDKYECGTRAILVNRIKAGFEFVGWFKDLALTDGPYKEYISSVESSTTFYAKWINLDEKNQTLADAFDAKVLELPKNLTTSDIEKIESILKEYSNLDKEVIDKLTTKNTINELTIKVNELKLDASANELALEIINGIKALNEVTIADELETINTLVKKYNESDTLVKDKVTNISVLNTAKENVDKLYVEINKVISNIETINKEVTLDDEATIIASRNAFEALPEASKPYITNLSILENKEREIRFYNNQIALAKSIVKEINDLPSVITLDDEQAIRTARSHYDNVLKQYGQELVDNLAKLEDAEKQLDDLKNADLIYVVEGIKKLPGVITFDYNEDIYQLELAYKNLTDAKKEKVTNYQKLVDASKAIDYLTTQNDIVYCLGKYVYESREALFKAFFTDFYYFIESVNGLANLKRNNIYTLEDFLLLAKDPNGGGTTNMRGIGNIAGSYLLKADLNGIASDQPTDKFIGYCVQNGMYEELIPFFINFFAYWRIDERYASMSNYGADFFAESWAPTVDIAKFFYYTKDTTYVKTERMLDCFTNTASVAFATYPRGIGTKTTILPTPTRRGYTFAGWYLNADYSGGKVTELSPRVSPYIVYAKWVEDTDQMDKDAAALVDTYIHNLLPTPANASKANVAKIRVMYNALSTTAKSYVTNYATLVEYESKFQADLLEEKHITINVIKPTVFGSFDIMKTEFLNDFNKITRAGVTNYSEFTTNRYGLMKNISTFFSDNEMYAKWGFVVNYIINCEGCAKGLNIQSKRALNQQSGDLEYLSKAIDGFFSKTNLTTDAECNIDLSNAEIVITNPSLQKVIVRDYTTESILPTLRLSGYTFSGYFDASNETSNKYTSVTVDTPNTLYAIFK